MPEKRTSLHLTSETPLPVNNSASITFDFSFIPNLDTYFGYIVRVISPTLQNIDLVYNQRLQDFNIILGDSCIGKFKIDSANLYNHWNQAEIFLDARNKSVQFMLNGQEIARGRLNIHSGDPYQVYFGTINYERFQAVDVPPMNIKDIVTREDGKIIRQFPLDEQDGEQAHDSQSKYFAKVKNPTWLKPKHQAWHNELDFSAAGAVSVAYNPDQDIIYFVSRDTLYQFHVKDLSFHNTPLNKSHGFLVPGNQSVYDKNRQRLVNFYADEKRVSIYDTAAKTWNQNFTTDTLTVFWQANKFISPVDSSLYIIGGYGQLRYKNWIQRYHFPSRAWEMIENDQDDIFPPRYLAALGLNEGQDTAYILGGYGSKTGDQSINPRFYYDLVAFSIRDHKFHFKHHLTNSGQHFCFANSLTIIPGTREYYALIYPTDRFKSSLQLIEGSLDKPGYTLLGDSIPYNFYDIESFADLFYSTGSQKLLAVTIYTGKDNQSRISVHSIFTPPNPPPVLESEGTALPPYWPFALVAITSIGFWAYWLNKKNKRGKGLDSKKFDEPPVMTRQQNAQGDIPKVETETVASSLEEVVHIPVLQQERAACYLFGPFEVYDKEGNNIVQMFTPLLKELFLLLLIYSIKDGKGISADKLLEMLWPGKSIKDAKNNYSVNIVKLKSILEKIGEFQLSRESDKLKLECVDADVYIDFQEFTQLIHSQANIDKNFVRLMAKLCDKGAFLSNVHYTWLDDLKGAISGQVIDTLLNYLDHANLNIDTEFMLRLTNYVFYFDSLNEEALVHKSRCLMILGRHGLAKDAYAKFAKEYRETYGQAFDRSFPEVMGPTTHT